MIDLHTHILPGIDDGVRDLEEAVDLARMKADEGVSVIAATPHLREDFPGVLIHEVADRVGEVNEALKAEAVPVTVVAGGEVDLVWALDASDEELALATYGQAGTDVLLETPFGMLPPGFENLVFQRLTRQGFRVLLAHPERCMGFRERPERLELLVERGILVQVTAMSLVGPKRSQARKLGHWLVERGLAHVIASDAHRPRNHRPPGMADGVVAAAALGEERARWMAEDAPRAILEGRPLPPVPAGKRKSLLSGMRRG